MGPDERTAGCLAAVVGPIALALSLALPWAWAVFGLSARIGWVWFATTVLAWLLEWGLLRGAADARKDGR